MGVQEMSQVRSRFDGQKRTCTLECRSKTRIPPLEEERILELSPAVCIIHHLAYWHRGQRITITGLHRFAAFH